MMRKGQVSQTTVNRDIVIGILHYLTLVAVMESPDANAHVPSSNAVFISVFGEPFKIYNGSAIVNYDSRGVLTKKLLTFRP